MHNWQEASIYSLKGGNCHDFDKGYSSRSMNASGVWSFCLRIGVELLVEPFTH